MGRSRGRRRSRSRSRSSSGDRSRRRRQRRKRRRRSASRDRRRHRRSSSSSTTSSASSGSRDRRSRRADRRRNRSSETNTPPRTRVEEPARKRTSDDVESKIEKAIKAAEAAGLTMCKLPSYEPKEVEIKEDMPTIRDRNALDEINSEGFTPKHFSSSKSKRASDNIVIDLDAGTVKVPDVDLPQADTLFHPDLFPDEKVRTDKWIKKMLQFRQKALRGEL